MTRHLVSPGVTFIFGRTYSGKTTLARELLTRRVNARVLWFDPSCAEALDGLPVLTSRAECRRFFLSDQSAGAWFRVVRFANVRDWDWLAASAVTWRGVTWVVDDAARLLRLPDVARVAWECSIGGRHFGGGAGVELWCIAHRPVDAPPNLRAQATAVYTFRQDSPNDVQLLAQWCGPDFAERVTQLDTYAALHWPELSATPGTPAPVVIPRATGRRSRPRATARSK